MTLTKLLYLILASVIGRIIAGLGLSFVTYFGFNELLEYLISQAIAAFQSLPMWALELFGTAQFDIAVNLVVSAYMARSTLAFARRLAFGVGSSS